MVDGEELWEGPCLGVVLLSGEDGVAQALVLPGGERFEHGLEQRLDIARLEDADYQGHSLTMLHRIATALNQRLEIAFAPVGEH